MITRNNLLIEYPRIFQSALPEALQQTEFEFIEKNFDLIDEADNEDFAKYVDTFIEKLNKVLEKQAKTPERPTSTFTKRDVTAEVLKTADERETSANKAKQKSPKPKREPKPKKEPKPKPPKIKKQTGNEVTEFPLPVTFIKA
jgi:hypothetical protein